MYLRSLTVKRLRLIEELPISFERPDGVADYAPWTVIIGPNGTAKTTLLHAIALAAAGSADVNSLGGAQRTRLRDRRASDDEPMEIDATFSFAQEAIDEGPTHFPSLHGAPTSATRLRSVVTAKADENALNARSWYEGQGEDPQVDPLRTVRSKDPLMNLWFVAGYGVARNLPPVGVEPPVEVPTLARLGSLFGPQPLRSLAWIERFEQSERRREFATTIRDALFPQGAATPLLPLLRDLELRGSGGVTRLQQLQEGERFVQRVGRGEFKVPSVSLSHGYQSMIAWVSDLVGQVLDEAPPGLLPKDFVGLVLIDEIDLYLHPEWQAVLIEALRGIFPRMQFVVTTHSPLVLATLRPGIDQIVRLGFDDASGDIVRIPTSADPRLLTNSQLLRRYFGVDELVDPKVRATLAEYQAIATDPTRDDEAEQRRLLLGAELALGDVPTGVTTLPRIPRP